MLSEKPFTDISESERLQWFISRLDLYHKINLQSIETSKTIFNNAGTKSLSKIKSRRKEIFSVLGVFFTLILGSNSFIEIPDWLFYSSLSILSGIGLILYMIFNRAEKMIGDLFTFMDTLAVYERLVLSQSQSFVATNYADLAFVKLNDVKDYGVFSLLVGIAIAYDMRIKLEKYYEQNPHLDLDIFDDDISELDKHNQLPDLLKKYNRDHVYPELGQDLIEKHVLTKK